MVSILKLPLKGLIKFVIVHPLSSMAIVVLLVVTTVFYTGNVSQPLGASAGANPAAPVIAKGNLPAAASTESFLTGQATYSADLVWDSLSEDLHQSLSLQGSDQQTMQEQLDEYKSEGRRMENFTYVGGYSPGGERSFYFYVASIRRPDLGDQLDHVFFAFTVDADGKIVSVE